MTRSAATGAQDHAAHRTGVRDACASRRRGTEAFALALFLARRRASQQLRDAAPTTTSSPCRRTCIGYKGMVLPDKLSTFFPDLQRSELTSSAIVFHQRFSTNTLPRWPLAHPFRLLAHNGEINTIEGNRALGAGAPQGVEDAALRHRASSTR